MVPGVVVLTVGDRDLTQLVAAVTLVPDHTAIAPAPGDSPVAETRYVQLGTDSVN